MTSFSEEILETNSGTITAWLPISTPWLSIAACSSQIYAQRAGLGGNLIAFDPLYGESIVPSAIPCLPTEVTSSWYQSNSAITTLLGPTFVCPGAYSAVETILVNSLMQQVLCCPSYVLLSLNITRVVYQHTRLMVDLWIGNINSTFQLLAKAPSLHNAPPS
jgi:hypothetical protein